MIMIENLRQRRRRREARQLFKKIAQRHRLGVSERRLLRALARRLKVRDAAVLFFRPSLLLKAASSSESSTIEKLGRRLFGADFPAPESSSAPRPPAVGSPSRHPE